jgi:UDP-N-acetyl-D-galactosamine dehydrogenase
LGFSFKENCPDFRNTKAIDVYEALRGFNLDVSVYDPWVRKQDVKEIYGIDLIEKLEHNYDAIIHVVAHKEFVDLDINELKSPSAVVYDVKGNLNTKFITNRL